MVTIISQVKMTVYYYFSLIATTQPRFYELYEKLGVIIIWGWVCMRLYLPLVSSGEGGGGRERGVSES